MKKKARRLVYTNIGFEADQHRTLKHLAVEARTDLASLVREAVDGLIREKRRSAIPYEKDFFLFELGRNWTALEDRPYKAEEWSQVDQDLYGPKP